MRAALLLCCVPGALAVLACAGPDTVERSSRAEPSLHPVTGLPVPALISEAEELKAAARQHEAIRSARRGGRLDPPGPHSAQLLRVFRDLTEVAHRRALPWQVHLIEQDEASAFTTGGGYVYVTEGCFGPSGLLAEGDDDELAALLAHQIAHVALLHTRIARSWQIARPAAARDLYDAPSFSSDQEAEADQLGALYMALAGYDPAAAARVWQRAGRFDRDTARFLYDHPLHPRRAEAAADAAGRVQAYYIPGRQNPDWQAIRADNPIFPDARTASVSRGRTAGSPGVASSLKSALDAQDERGAGRRSAPRPPPPPRPAARREPPPRRGPPPDPDLVKLVGVETGRELNGKRSIQMEFQNGANQEVTALAIRVLYYRGPNAIDEDPDCGGPTTIPAGQSAWLLCDLKKVKGATDYEVHVTGVDFR